MSFDQFTKKRILRAVVYIRMSSPDQKDSPQRQWEQLIPYIEKQGYQLMVKPYDPDLPYQDLGMRGDAERPGLERLVRDAQAGLFDVIVIDEPSRLSRQEEDVFIAEVRLPLRRAGIVVDVVGKGILDWESVAGKILATIQQEGSRVEPVNNSKRVLSNGLALMKAGRPVSCAAPFGYLWNYLEVELGGGRKKQVPTGLIVDPATSHVVAQMFQRYLERDSLLGLVNWLDDLGICPPRSKKTGRTRWYATSVRKVLTNEVYTGILLWNRTSRSKHHRTSGGVVVPKDRKLVSAPAKSQAATPNDRSEWVVSDTPHQPLVTREVFDAVQLLLEKNQNGQNGSSPSSRLLSGLLKCEHCRRVLTAAKSGRQRRPQYRCRSYLYGEHGPCRNAKIREDVVMQQIIQVLKDTFLDAQHLDVIRQAIAQQEAADKEPVNVKKVQEGIAKLKRDIANARGNLVFLEPEEIPVARDKIRPLSEKLALLEEDLRAIERPSALETLNSYVEAVMRNLSTLEKTWQTGDQKALRILLEQLIVRVTIRWTNAAPTTGNPKYTHRIPAGGVIFVRGLLANASAVYNGLPDCTTGESEGFGIPFTFPEN